MKNYSYIGISFIILVFGIYFVPKIIHSIQDDEVVVSDRLSVPSEDDNRKKKESREEAISYVVLNGERKKVPDFQFVDQNGDTISKEDYLGKVYVVEFFFTTCPSICPIMNENLVEVQKEFKDSPDFGIASISIDPEYDTPRVLKAYAEEKGITHPNWHLLTGDRKDIYNLANNGFGIYVGEDADASGGFAHSGLFALIDKQGYIRSRTDSFGNPLIYYRGSIKQGEQVAPGEEEPQIEILVEDIKTLLE